WLLPVIFLESEFWEMPRALASLTPLSPCSTMTLRSLLVFIGSPRFCILSRYILAQFIHLCKRDLYPLGNTLYLFFRDMVVYDETGGLTLTKGVMVWRI